MSTSNLSGDDLLRMLSALASPHRLRILALLTSGRKYVSLLARELGLSRPLVHLHLQKLEAVGLVVSSMEVSESGKAMNWYSVSPFTVQLNPQIVAEAAKTITVGKDHDG